MAREEVEMHNLWRVQRRQGCRLQAAVRVLYGW